MTALPSQHPHLALHLTDRALTPVISSSFSAQPPPSPTSSSQPRPSSKRPPAFSTSPPPSSPESDSSLDDEEEDDNDSDDDDAADDDPKNTPSPASSLSLLTSTALASYDTAKRLDRGAPLRTMVEYGGGRTRGRARDGDADDDAGSPEDGGGGPVVLHSYMCPMGLALGVPGRRDSQGSLATATGMHPDAARDEGGGGGGGPEQQQQQQHPESPAQARRNGKDRHVAEEAGRQQRPAPLLHPPLQIYREGDGERLGDHDDGDVEAPNAPPMLISTVVAPGTEHLRDARRAAARLERLARGLQAEWVLSESGGAAT